MIVPHAGYAYSGTTAAAAYRRLRGREYDSVVIVSPSHREGFQGVSVFPGVSYETPLGTVAVDDELRNRLLEATPVVSASHHGHADEHAVEVQLPFLQETLKKFRFLPLVMGDQQRETCRALGEALATVLDGRRALLVASTDLSHYHSAAFASHLDERVRERVGKLEYEGLLDELEAGDAEACGGRPMAAVLMALDRLGARTVEITHHCTSGDITGDRRSVVGYMSAIVYH
jgi:AmmeMemoRadiSam system protein B